MVYFLSKSMDACTFTRCFVFLKAKLAAVETLLVASTKVNQAGAKRYQQSHLEWKAATSSHRVGTMKLIGFRCVLDIICCAGVLHVLCLLCVIWVGWF